MLRLVPKSKWQHRLSFWRSSSKTGLGSSKTAKAVLHQVFFTRVLGILCMEMSLLWCLLFGWSEGVRVHHCLRLSSNSSPNLNTLPGLLFHLPLFNLFSLSSQFCFSSPLPSYSLAQSSRFYACLKQPWLASQNQFLFQGSLCPHTMSQN